MWNICTINDIFNVVRQNFTKHASVNVLQSIPVVINGIRCGQADAVAKALEDISQSIQEMTDRLKLMHGTVVT